uniref:Uncharacterized protein n=1 Tax=Ditylenchus dipsaci TaxID=166011 RepID=A0A915CYH1_9BILA
MLTHKAAQQQQQLLGGIHHANYSATGEGNVNHQQLSAPFTSCSSSVSPPAVAEHAAGQQGNNREEFVDTTVVKQEVMQEDCNNNNNEMKFDVAQLISGQNNLMSTNTQQIGGILPKPTSKKRGWRPANPHVSNVQSVPLPATSTVGSTDLEECQRWLSWPKGRRLQSSKFDS